jgi:hypothetical protein
MVCTGKMVFIVKSRIRVASHRNIVNARSNESAVRERSSKIENFHCLTHSLSHFRFSLCVGCEDTGSCVLNEYCNETLAYTGGRCLCVVLE